MSDLILHILYVVVQFYPWFEFYLLLFQTHNYISIPKNKGKENLNQGIKLNHNMYSCTCEQRNVAKCNLGKVKLQSNAASGLPLKRT